ncbi:MAG: hypothetical protein ACD_30C00049G0004 [uncultured bacterium]|uniref:Uncharacterized protein n=4 Tax=Candidatus Daviesiibacteriota TaxID=1752718 RepID=A0A0G0FB03_9BACT|nr:MAG: hypothetical protein ACD_30C00049G0004 [uncultured bacterium]KKQ10700.1 MAG: hypothetical protein US19_C0001G0038 [Candidatus Daviesbacteria bacterium GW2011_GWB1_36_5]KKQ14508.1 MAG: hypothetical protein US28_C0035G0002 [Candidatus Daviesbacteria bacterium GW2011_GWA1_36_8]OGE16866.1 MAG: hypothetical protein A2858_03090 [Candidatus Daviesbacteria bacterium RIFCSPHIGHO2_01_FULL_36_37]OGE31222.1 MAG: hypothetical protein A3C99_01065 [Candidatus Daviesbacteria bacterium RIFCSPHIGHO2_02_F
MARNKSDEGEVDKPQRSDVPEQEGMEQDINKGEKGGQTQTEKQGEQQNDPWQVDEGFLSGD